MEPTGLAKQRPSELSETILAQVGTFISLRLTNSSDQPIVKSMAPNNTNSSDPEFVNAWAKEYDSANDGYKEVVKKLESNIFKVDMING